MLRANRQSAPEPGITPLPTYRRTQSPRKSARDKSDAPVPLEIYQRIPFYALAKPVSPMADGDLLGLARRRDYCPTILAFCMAAEGRSSSFSSLGQPDAERFETR